MRPGSAQNVSHTLGPRPPSWAAPSIWYDAVLAPNRNPAGRRGERGGCPAATRRSLSDVETTLASHHLRRQQLRYSPAGPSLCPIVPFLASRTAERPPDADESGDNDRQRGSREMVPSGEETRIRSLAAMARALGRSEALFRLLEIAAEEAQVAMRRRQRLGQPAGPRHLERPHHRQRRRPRPQRGPLARERDLHDRRVRQPQARAGRAAELDLARRGPRLPRERAGPAPRARQGVVDRRPADRGRPALGRVLRHPAPRRARVRRPRHRLHGGAARDPLRRGVAGAARGVARSSSPTATR